MSRQVAALAAAATARAANATTQPCSLGTPEVPVWEPRTVATIAAPIAPATVRMLAFMPAAALMCELGTAFTTCAESAESAIPKPSPPMAPPSRVFPRGGVGGEGRWGEDERRR